jgi:hypothetical protein
MTCLCTCTQYPETRVDQFAFVNMLARVNWMELGECTGASNAYRAYRITVVNRQDGRMPHSETNQCVKSGLLVI